MIRLILALGLIVALGSPAAHAERATVVSGEHPEFTRLVVTLESSRPWQFGRTEDGYELRVSGQDLTYDLSRAFSRIPKTRLAAIWQDDDNSGLRFAIACACHAVPFEFRPGTLVIDIRDGPPDKDSPFETPLPTVENATPAPAANDAGPPDLSYDWKQTPSTAAPAEPPQIQNGNDLTPLRETLLRQMADGASRGTVELGPDLSRDQFPRDKPAASLPQIHIGEDIGINMFMGGVLDGAQPPDPACLPDDILNIADWGDDLPAAMQLSEIQQGLIGEFDRPDPAAVARAARRLLYLGFGTEARQLIRQMQMPESEAGPLHAMAAILDGQPPDPNPFETMAACDSSVALWAFLAAPDAKRANQLNTGAVIRTFSALPSHLRTHLGAELGERFLSLGDTDAARAIRDAVLRAPIPHGPQSKLLDATIDIAIGDSEGGEAALHTLAAEGGPMEAEALMKYVASRVAAERPVDQATVASIEALLAEHKGDSQEPKLRASLSLAHAAAGDFTSAFSLRDVSPDTGSRIWQMLASQASDSAFVEHAVLAPFATLPDLPQETVRLIADRLSGLGFPAPAQRWVQHLLAGQAAPEELDRLLAGRIALQNSDLAGALRFVDGLASPEAGELRARAHLRSGDAAAAAQLFEEIGKTDDAQSAARRARIWPTVADGSDPRWQTAAKLLEPVPPITSSQLESSPIAAGQTLVAESRMARETLLDLLSGTGPGR